MPFFIFFLEIPIKEVLDGSREGYEASASIFRSRSSDRSGTIVFRREVSETLRWQPSLFLLRRWLVLAFIVSLIVLIGALSFASGEAYGKDGGQSSPTSGDSGGGGGGGSDKGGSGGGGGDSTTDPTSGGGGGGSADKSGSGGGGGGDTSGGGTSDTGSSGSTNDTTNRALDMTTNSLDTSSLSDTQQLQQTADPVLQ